MGAGIRVEGNTAIISGVPRFTGAMLTASDLRAGAALVIAGLAADGYTYIDEIRYVLRGYEDFDEKIRNLGGEIEIAESEEDITRFKLKVV